MKQNFIPEQIARFLIDKVDSIAELEALLLLRNEPAYRWTPQDVSKRLYLSDKDAFEILVRLSTKGLVLYKASGVGWYKYQPGSAKVRKMIDRLSRAYSEHMIAVTNLIHSKSKDKVRDFADAFKFRADDSPAPAPSQRKNLR